MITPLETLIRDAIRAQPGGLPFTRFMELALYHPKYGYYRRADATRIGPTGDYVTSVSVTPLFGKILARQIAAIRDDMGAPPDFTVVEYGAHRGQLKADIHATLPGLPYRTVEIGDAPPASITGCVLANEFLDALPVHRVRVVNGAWRELYIVEGPGGPSSARPLHETPGPLSTPRLAAALADLPARYMEGYTTEINLQALDWLEDASRRLVRGAILLIDYGEERHEYFSPHRHEGTLTCYHRHQRSGNPFLHLGEQDITAHVEFTSFMEKAKDLGLRVQTFTDQGRYLLEAGADLVREIAERDAGQLSRDRAALQQLTHPNFMGRAFKVLVLRKE